MAPETATMTADWLASLRALGSALDSVSTMDLHLEEKMESLTVPKLEARWDEHLGRRLGSDLALETAMKMGLTKEEVSEME